MHVIVLLCTLGAVLALAGSALHDVAVRTVPNALVAALALCAVALAAIQHRLPGAAVAASMLLLAALGPWLRGWLGGGDAKLLAASGLLLAPGAVLPMLLATTLAGGVLCLPYLPGKRLFERPAPVRPARLLARCARCERWRLRRRGPLPYAVAIAAGAIFSLLHGT